MTRAPTPREAGFRLPAEWEPHGSCWVALPYRAEEWPAGLEAAQKELGALCRAIASAQADGSHRGETLDVLVPDDAHAALAQRLLAGAPARLRRMRYGDSWTRDTGPLFVRDEQGQLGAACFAFNGWGGRYRMPGDEDLARRIADEARVRRWRFEAVVEGGAVDVDGEGTVLASRTCLLNPNRNPGWSEAQMERLLCEALGAERVLWIEGALLNDHTDGHTDTLARFVAPGLVACMEAQEVDDPNRETLRSVAKTLARATDARGRRITLSTLPSPGTVSDTDGVPLPASYCNFYIGNRVVVVPGYDRTTDGVAVARLETVFADRRVVHLPARTTLTGGGGWHCITQPQPRAGASASRAS